jgi:hypothetical protein
MKGLIDLIANIGFKGTHKQARDTLGRVYEYFLGKFAQAEGKLGGDIEQGRQNLEKAQKRYSAQKPKAILSA